MILRKLLQKGDCHACATWLQHALDATVTVCTDGRVDTTQVDGETVHVQIQGDSGVFNGTRTLNPQGPHLLARLQVNSVDRVNWSMTAPLGSVDLGVCFVWPVDNNLLLFANAPQRDAACATWSACGGGVCRLWRTGRDPRFRTGEHTWCASS